MRIITQDYEVNCVIFNTIFRVIKQFSKYDNIIFIELGECIGELT